ncbi:MAG: hypothetical protein ACR2NP_22000 [Pirellulaceae bacterium]
MKLDKLVADLEHQFVERAGQVAPSEDLSEQIGSTIERSLRRQTRRDDLRLLITCAGSLVLLAGLFYGLANIQKGNITKTIDADRPTIQQVIR